MPLPELPTLEEHAAEWIWRLDPSEFTAADLQAFNTWLRQNPGHRRAAQEFFGLWLALNSVASTRRRTYPPGVPCVESGRNVS
jgi:ferric-dicitrate binding protein FerR (iron transport regulator)